MTPCAVLRHARDNSIECAEFSGGLKKFLGPVEDEICKPWEGDPVCDPWLIADNLSFPGPKKESLKSNVHLANGTK
jgi:hypothetical protein